MKKFYQICFPFIRSAPESSKDTLGEGGDKDARYDGERETTYVSNPTFTSFVPTFKLPTYRTTAPAASASSLIFVISPSNPPRPLRNSSALPADSRGFGMSDWMGNEVGDSTSIPERRARMVSFLATSRPLRSSRGSGSCHEPSTLRSK